MAVVLVKNLPRFSGTTEAEIAARLRAGRSESFIYVAPTKRKVRSLERDFLSQCPSGASGPFALFTLETLAEAVCALLLPPKRKLSDQLRAAVVQEAIRLRAGDLGYFTLRGPSRRLPRGTLSRIAAVINRLKASGIYLSALLQEIGEGEESERLKLRDIALIYETYERLLDERAYVDPPGLFRDANLAWAKPGSAGAFRARFPEADFLAVTGFDEFSDPELTLLHYLSETPGLGTVVSFDYHPDNDPLFGHLKENYTKFLATGFTLAGAPAVGMPPFHAHIARRLFSVPGEGEPRFEAGGIVTACPAPDRVREAELVARIIRTSVADTPGLGLRDICVCTPEPELYSAIFREVFEQSGVPANITDRFHLEESSLVTGIVSMLLVAQNNFRIGDIVRAAVNPFLVLAARPGGPGVDASNLLAAAAGLRTVSGRKRWFDRIEARIRFLTDIRPVAGGRPGGRTASEIARLADAKRDLEAIDRLVAGFRLPMTPGGFRDAVLRLADDLRVAESIAAAGSAGAGMADVEREARAWAEFLRFMDEFPGILELESPPGESHPLSWYLERFRPLLSQVRYNVRQRYGEGVLVTSIDETRGLSFRVMILAGLVDGEFPRLYEPEIFLTPKTRARRERYHLHEQRYLFYQALSGCTGCVFLTWPLKDRSVDLNPSEFLEWLESAAAISRYAPDEEHPFTHTLVTPDEVLAGRVAGGREPAGDAAPEDETMAHVRRAIAAESARRHDSGGDEYRGILDPETLPARAASDLASYRRAAYSVTQLETYGDCPFRFFAGRVLRLKTPEPPEEGITPKEMGRILHEILYEFYAGRRERGLGPIAGIAGEGYREALADLRSIAARKFDETAVDDVFWEISRETVLGGEGWSGILEDMLSSERDSGVDAAPAYFEVRFGRAGEDLKYSDASLFSEDPVPAGGIFLQGKIDRIDTAAGLFRVVDYKTGSGLPSKKEVDEGASLQLPLYLHCAEWVLAQKAGRTMTGGAGIYYHLRQGFQAVPRVGSGEYSGSLLEPGRRFRLTDDAQGLRDRVAAAVARADAYAARISRGIFPVEPRDPSKTCRTCDFRRMCRIRTRISPGQGTSRDGAQDVNE